jgi:hypothetical protein
MVYESKFRAFQSSAALRALSDRDAAAIFRATSTVGYYDPTPARLAEFRRDLAELERRSIATPDQIRDVYGAIYQVRAFDQMPPFVQSHTGLDLPHPIAITAPFDRAPHGILEIADAEHVTPQYVELTHGHHLIVVAHPGCHYTQRAVAAIEHDPSLKAAIASHSTWIVPADRNPDLTPFVAWNHDHPEAAMSLVSARAAWPEVDVWQTPLFLYFEDGKLVDKIVGWPAEGNMEALRKMVARASDSPR